jgi:hypothetical protein
MVGLQPFRVENDINSKIMDEVKSSQQKDGEKHRFRLQKIKQVGVMQTDNSILINLVISLSILVKKLFDYSFGLGGISLALNW